MKMISKEIYTTYRSAHTSKKGEYNMDIDKLQKIVSDVKSFDSPRWTSSKLWVTVSVIGGLIWLCNAAIQTIIWPVTILAGVWLISRTIEGVFEGINKVEVKKAIIKEQGKDLSEQEMEVLTK